MKLKTDEPYIPQDVLLKIEELKSILAEANELYEEIIEWYDSELNPMKKEQMLQMNFIHQVQVL